MSETSIQKQNRLAREKYQASLPKNNVSTEITDVQESQVKKKVGKGLQQLGLLAGFIASISGGIIAIAYVATATGLGALAVFGIFCLGAVIFTIFGSKMACNNWLPQIQQGAL